MERGGEGGREDEGGGSGGARKSKGRERRRKAGSTTHTGLLPLPPLPLSLPQQFPAGVHVRAH